MYVAAFQIDGVIHYVLWMPDGEANDMVIGEPGRIWRFPTEEACRGSGEAKGSVEREPAQVQDFDPVLTWLAEPNSSVPVASALGLWNFAGDVARGEGFEWPDHGEIRDTVYDRLFSANLPWVVGEEEGLVIEWSPDEHTALRTTLADAIDLVRRSLPTT